MRKIIFFASVCVLFFCNIAYASSDHLWISQIQTTGGTGKTTNDFVEIYNPTYTDLDLNGLRLVKRTTAGTTDTLLKSWTDSTIIKAGGYYLWANSAFSDISVTPDIATSGSIADDSGIALRQGANDTGTIIDSVAWGSTTNAFVEVSATANPAVNQALERTQDTDNNSADFSIIDANPHNSISVGTANPPPPPPPALEPEPTPPPAPLPPPPPPPAGGGIIQPSYSQAVIISEFLPNPDGTDSGEEWIELYNTSGADIDISGWKLDDEGASGIIGSSSYTFPVASIIKASAFLVVDLPEGNFALNNTGGDSVRLFWPNKVLATQVDYKDSVKEDISYARKSDNTFAWTYIVTKGSINQFGIVAPKVAADAKVTEPEAKKDSEVAKQNIEIPEIVISEIFPEPLRKSTQEEYIELFNPTENAVDLTGFKLADLAGSHKLDGVIAANGFLVIKKSESNISLNNSGMEQVSLTSPNGVEIANLSYEDAPQNQSYNLTADGNYFWSGTLTPGKQNRISAVKIAGAVKKVVAETDSDQSIDQEALPAELASYTSEPVGQISGAQYNVPPTSSEKNLWKWMIGSFAVNLAFCYSLVKLMIKKA